MKQNTIVTEAFLKRNYSQTKDREKELNIAMTVSPHHLTKVLRMVMDPFPLKTVPFEVHSIMDIYMARGFTITQTEINSMDPFMPERKESIILIMMLHYLSNAMC